MKRNLSNKTKSTTKNAKTHDTNITKEYYTIPNKPNLTKTKMPNLIGITIKSGRFILLKNIHCKRDAGNAILNI